ncbi:MAG: hypothetical protein K9N47_08590 [Prosthecobacter sp.]|uniref:hypothetical protein n=1 Tax=Prosthecobacter sp. TaxID=1965333 RepID=UPI0025F974BE|nr:hypothetical protein [Prosthecobacter sp.]MCF7786167.1 hypothetical protein [Prosthecobacter sp.]
MKAWLILLAVASPLSAQVVLPATGKKFDTRTINGSGGNTGVSVNNTAQPAPPTKTKLTSYFRLGDPRQWKSTDGRSLLGTIIIFEESVIEFDAANPAAAREAVNKAPPPKMPDKPTLIREGKIRLLVSQKPVEVPLDRLSDEDRKYVEDLNARLPK